MKKLTTGGRVAASRANRVPKNVDEYIANLPETSRSALKKMRAAIRSAVPAEATEVISYRIPAFKHQRVLLWYAAFAKHCSLFPTAAVIEELKDELKSFSTSKGTIHFPNGKPLPIALIKAMVRARVAQAESKERS